MLGRPLQFEKGVVHDGKSNSYKFQKDGIKHTLFPLQEEGGSISTDLKAILMSGKEVQ